jgi:hypothetical protein
MMANESGGDATALDVYCMAVLGALMAAYACWTLAQFVHMMYATQRETKDAEAADPERDSSDCAEDALENSQTSIASEAPAELGASCEPD